MCILQFTVFLIVFCVLFALLQWDNNPREKRPETGLLAMRKQLGLFANLRPAKVMRQLLDASTLKPEVTNNQNTMKLHLTNIACTWPHVGVLLTAVIPAVAAVLCCY
jgi:Isocitrate/isopropylmalate dehydrogenase